MEDSDLARPLRNLLLRFNANRNQRLIWSSLQTLPWTALAQPPPQGFLERRWEIRWAVPTPTPNSLEIARQEAPEARRVSNRLWLTKTGGRPSRFPFARALRKPALTRSWISDLSNSAM